MESKPHKKADLSESPSKKTVTFENKMVASKIVPKLKTEDLPSTTQSARQNDLNGAYGTREQIAESPYLGLEAASERTPVKSMAK